MPNPDFFAECIQDAGENGNVAGIIVLMQQGGILKGIMFNKIWHCILFKQSENFLNIPHVVQPNWQFEYGPNILTSRFQKNKGLS